LIHFYKSFRLFIMGTLLRDSIKCRFCAEEVENGSDVYGTEYMTCNSYRKNDHEKVVSARNISYSEASEKYLKLKLDPNSPFPRYICFTCKTGLQELINFIDKLEVGQENLARILISEGGEILNKKRGRPKKGFEKKVKEIVIEDNYSTVGKRKIKMPKKFDEMIHDITGQANEEKDDSEEKNADLEKYKLNIDEGESITEEISVSIDMSTLSNTKTNQANNPVFDEINSILTQFEKKEAESDTVLYCELCELAFKSPESLDLHIKSSHGQIMYKCDINNCNSLLRSREELRSHQSNFGHEEFIILEIGSPKEALKLNIDSLKEDALSVDSIVEKISEKFICDECSIELGSQQKFNIHMAEFHGVGSGSKVYRCMESGCSRTFTAASSLTYHKFSTHNKSVFICPESGCNKQFKIKNLLTRHLKTHCKDRTFACEKCDKSFKTKSNLYSHAIVHQQEPKFFCDECGQQFKHRTSLTSHMRWHQGEKPFKCPFCSKCFNQNGNLQEHIRIHTGEKPFKCDMCPRAFTTSSQHRLHVKRHMGVKQFKCDYCEKAFLNKDTFKTHLRRHKGEKPFACKFCKKAFAEAWALTKHLRFHTGQQPYLCKECGKRFSDSSNLAKHKKTHEDYLSKDKQTVWNIVKDAGSGMQETEVLEDSGEEVQQVIYIAYEGDDKNEDSVKEGIDIEALSVQDITLQSEVELQNHVQSSSGPLLKLEQMHYKDQLEPHSVKIVENQDVNEENNQMIDLTMKDGQQIRLVAPLNIDPLAFATEYFKDMQNLSKLI